MKPADIKLMCPPAFAFCKKPYSDGMQTYSIETIAEYCQPIIELLNGSAAVVRVIALHGDLGAGKTTFVQQLGQQLGVTDPITSPTFGILARYQTTHPTWQTLLHMDAYRLETEAELGPLRFVELLQETNTIFCIEWAERIVTALPAHTTHLTFSIAEAETRSIQVATHEEWLRAR